MRCETIRTVEAPLADTCWATPAAVYSDVSRKVATGQGTSAAIAAILRSSIARGEGGFTPTNPTASAPARMASCASSSEAIQQILIRVRIVRDRRLSS